EEWEVIVEDARDDDRLSTQAIVRGRTDSDEFHEIATGNGPVNALDGALRKAIGARYPQLAPIHLTDYKVRVLDTHKSTGAVTRVLVERPDAEEPWTPIGVGENIIEAPWRPREDPLVSGLLRAGAPG